MTNHDKEMLYCAFFFLVGIALVVLSSKATAEALGGSVASAASGVAFRTMIGQATTKVEQNTVTVNETTK